jgi:ABC-type sugar transport system permease subunit
MDLAFIYDPVGLAIINVRHDNLVILIKVQWSSHPKRSLFGVLIVLMLLIFDPITALTMIARLSNVDLKWAHKELPLISIN